MKVWKSRDVFRSPLEGAHVDAAIAHLEHGTKHPAIPKYAATVMLVRDAAGVDTLNCEVSPDTSAVCGDCEGSVSDGASGAVEVFMLRRAKTMAFVPDAVVFPGGSVDPRDSDTNLPWAGLSPAAWALRMGCAEELARRIVIAAAREVFEECGILLAGPDEKSVIGDLTDPLWDEERKLLSSHTESFAEVLIRRNLVFRSDLLGLRSHWVTPTFEPRRYDTFFFAALAPAGQVPDDRTSEAQAADWVSPAVLFEQAEKGHALLLPPTRYNLSFLLQAKSASEFVTNTPLVERIMLEPNRTSAGEVVLECKLP